MNLHYSQTYDVDGQGNIGLIPLWIYITLKHNISSYNAVVVLYLYEFTLLSNNKRVGSELQNVLYLYEFTLLSNRSWG